MFWSPAYCGEEFLTKHPRQVLADRLLLTRVEKQSENSPMIVRPSLKLAKEAEIRALGNITASLADIPQVEKIVVFGSRVRGDFRGSSDLDVLLVLSDIRVKNRAIGILHDIELEYDVPISPVIFTKREYEINEKMKSKFIANVEKEGIVLYDANG